MPFFLHVLEMGLAEIADMNICPVHAYQFISTMRLSFYMTSKSLDGFEAS